MNQPREDILISRVIDGDANPGEWDELAALAERDTGTWPHMAARLRDHQAFARAVNVSVEAADEVELPRAHAGPGSLRFAGWRGWSGWAVAAAVTLMSVGGLLALPRAARPLSGDPVAQTAGTTDDLLRAYLDRGRQEQSVIGEVPERVLIDMRPAESGDGYELLYLRPILERAVVPDLYRYEGRDDLGRPTLVSYDAPQGPPM